MALFANGDELHRLARRVLLFGGVGLVAFFVAETTFEMWRQGVYDIDLFHLPPQAGRALATTVSRAFNNLLAMVLSFVAIAIPITANMYTPKLVEIFFRDRVNVACLSSFAAMGAHAIYAQWVMVDSWSPATQTFVLWTSGVLGFVVVVPYYLYVLHFLNPATIITRVRDGVVASFPSGRAGEDTGPDARRRSADRVLQLGNVILRAVDRADRDVAIHAIEALESVLVRYEEEKPRIPDAWYEVERDVFPGFSTDAIALLRREHTWIEHACLQQLHLTYVAALARMPDAVSAISKVNRRTARRAATRGDDAVLRLAIRFLNTFLRAGIARRDAHAVFDVFHQYRELAIELLAHRPARSLEIARHMRYYGQLARLQGLAFVCELAAAEVSVLVHAAYEKKSERAPAILAELQMFQAGDGSARLVKGLATLAAWFRSSGLVAEASDLERELLELRPADLETARRDVAAAEDPVFWEVTDRQTNLDYLPPEQRAAVIGLLDRLLERRRSESAGS